MELRHLRTFVAVAELRHFARAASRCNLSQPAVSHQIALLEQDVGTKLPNRASRHVSMTVAGEVFLEESRRILGAVDRAHERMQEVARGAIGRIRLGATATPGLYLLPPLLARYRRAHESFDLRFEIAPLEVLADRVASNDLDMAIVSGALPSRELRARSLMADELIAQVSDTTPAFTTYTSTNPAAITGGSAPSVLTVPANGATGPLKFNIGTLNPGEQAIATFGVKIDQ